jgi:undecaprenyl-diphosphatase
VSFIVAYPVVRLFIDFISRFGLKPFGWYRVAIGIAALAATLL